MSEPLRKKKPRKARAKAKHGTRRGHIVDVTLELLLENDVVTTGMVTERIGIVQSGFYAHFPSIEACLQEAAGNAQRNIREPVKQGIVLLQAHTPGDTQLLTRFYDDLLQRALELSTFVTLFLRRRRDITPVGLVLREFELDLERDLIAHLDALGLGTKGPAHILMMTRLLLAQSFAALETWLASNPQSLDDQACAIDGRALARLLAGMNSKLGEVAEETGFA